MAILADAVAALRLEVSQSHAESRELAAETQRLHGEIALLQRRLAKSREENAGLKRQIRTLEKRLHEIHPAPAEAAATAAAPPPAQAPPPASAAETPAG